MDGCDQPASLDDLIKGIDLEDIERAARLLDAVRSIALICEEVRNDQDAGRRNIANLILRLIEAAL